MEDQEDLKRIKYSNALILFEKQTFTPRVTHKNSIAGQSARLTFSQLIDSKHSKFVTVSFVQIRTGKVALLRIKRFSRDVPIGLWHRQVNGFNHVPSDPTASIVQWRFPMQVTTIFPDIIDFYIPRRRGLVYFSTEKERKLRNQINAPM